MATEDTTAAIDRILDELAKRPEDRVLLQEQLRVKLAELKNAGEPLPDRYLRYEADLDEDDDYFNNMPV